MFIFAPVQGEGGKPGERGVMGAVGATVSIWAFVLHTAVIFYPFWFIAS